MTTVEFFGLCALMDSDKAFQASLPNVAEHRTVLFLAAGDLNIDASTPPDIIIHDNDGVQRVGWILNSARLRFEGGVGKAVFSDTERAKFLDLRDFHKGQKIKPPKPVIFDLPGGDLTAGEAENFEVSFDGTVVDPNKSAAVSALWTGAFTTLIAEAGGLTIKLKDGAHMTVSNVAPVKDGTSHFHHYYDFFDPEPPAKQVTIKHRTQSDRLRIMGVEIFDCVPPLPIP